MLPRRRSTPLSSSESRILRDPGGVRRRRGRREAVCARALGRFSSRSPSFLSSVAGRASRHRTREDGEGSPGFVGGDEAEEEEEEEEAEEERLCLFCDRKRKREFRYN